MIFSFISTTVPTEEIKDVDAIPSTEPKDKLQEKPSMLKEIQCFKLPISYLENSELYPLSETVSNDLELTTTTENTKCMYEYLFQPKHEFAKFLIPEWRKQYTTNTDYLNDTQEIIKKMGSYSKTFDIYSYQPKCERLTEIWDTLKNDKYFLEKYSYLDWDFLKYLNKSPYFLQFITFMNVTSPIISLLVPIMLLIFPFLLLKLQRIPISFSTYLETLKHIARNHFIGKTLFNMENFSWDKLVYVIFSFVLYLLQIYNNVNSCYRFYKNMDKINTTLLDVKKYTEYSALSMKTYLDLTEPFKSYKSFNNDVKKHCETLEKIQEELKTITKFNISMQKFGENGYMMKCFYELYENPEYEKSIRFSMGFEAYINNLLGVFDNYDKGIVCFADFDKGAVCHFKKQHYPPLVEENPVKNDCSFKKNIIISAPNKAGKTTILKTTTINIIFTQQIGCGFYEGCNLKPYTHIHSYLNIPDTSGRDSLFQAESRRCKDILDIIEENKDTEKYRHFCIFDELYSGTNPQEACKAGCAFLKYLTKFSNVDFVLTTHYLSICKQFRKSDKVQNYKMEVNVLPDGKFEYMYKMKKGVSKIKGAIRVLKDMDYPKEIIDSIEN